MFLRTNSTQLTAKSSTLLIKWLLFVGALLAAWSMAGGEVKAATSARLTRPGLARPGPGSTSSFEPAALVTIDGQKSFFQPFLGRDLEIRGFFPYFLSPNPLIPAKTFLEDYNCSGHRCEARRGCTGAKRAEEIFSFSPFFSVSSPRNSV